ncbi:MAG TPA: hypothetical protein VGS07_22315 [Thermoanaerobaculia bacterium]|jgi:hypothetical protein|nr:hypothetical protein [Thermoanaerobaculia bacterium]
MSFSIRTLDVESTAGAIAVSARALAIGTQDGYELFEYPSLERSDRVGGLWSEGCSGIQFCEDGLVMLGHDVSQSFSHPADWDHSLLHLQTDGRVRRSLVGPGNWNLVKGLQGSTAVIYDSTEGQGVKAVRVDDNIVQWTLPGEFNRVVRGSLDRLLALGDSALAVLAAEGAVVQECDLPLSTEVRWTALAEHAGAFVLGGYGCESRDYVMARWTPGGRPTQRVLPMSDVFSRSTIERVLADEDCCGADLFHVAAIDLQTGGKVVVALGGDGERLGACQGACAVALFDPSTLELLQSEVINETDGANGMLLAPDGGIIVNCCGSLHVVHLS